MSLFNNAITGASGNQGYNISRSVRLRSSATGYFSRTPASTTNRRTWTWSGWIKRGSDKYSLLFAAGNTTDIWNTGTNCTYIAYGITTNQLTVYNNGTTYRNTAQVFRDFSSWYHIVVAFDTTQATAANRLRVYINGSEVTSWDTNNAPTQNVDMAVNVNQNHFIGGQSTNVANAYYDGYLTEINFIDGQALTPSSFGSTNAITGVWQPAKYTGTYGTNGFYLNFSDNSAATAAAIGKDSSGNGNNWTPNNISVTAGSTYDSMTDVPTLTSATAANYCVMSPLDIPTSGSPATLSNGNLACVTPSSGYGFTTGTIAASSGKWYWEYVATAGSNFSLGFGLTTCARTYAGDTGSYMYYGSDGKTYANAGAGVTYGATWTTGDVIGVALNLDSGTATFYKNNVSQGTAFTGLSGTFFPIFSDQSPSASNTFTANFGQQPFTYTPPSGYVALNTYNLPASTISNGATVMAATLYTGTASAQSINNSVNSVSFKPDFVWIKNRSNSGDHGLVDSVRGRALSLYSDLTSAEGTSGSTQDLTSFNTNGFSVGTQFNFSCNASANTYVAWQWQAGQGTTSSNTSGSITSTVSVNATAGFSIVSYTGSGATATVGHGLGVAPSMIILKNRTSAGNDWPVYHVSIGAVSRIYLDTTGTPVSDPTGFMNSTAPTSTVFTVGSNSSVNGSTNAMIAYCWAAVKGFSAFGSYTGNGSSDGPFVYTGFRPRFVLLKRTDNIGNWNMFDSSRNGYNQTNPLLFANTSDAEYTTAGAFEYDILSNGFKVRNTGTGVNANGATVVYACFAENPFKNALAR